MYHNNLAYLVPSEMQDGPMKIPYQQDGIGGTATGMAIPQRRNPGRTANPHSRPRRTTIRNLMLQTVPLEEAAKEVSSNSYLLIFFISSIQK